MTRIFTAFILIFLSSGLLLAETIEKIYYFSNPTITNSKEFQQLHFDNCLLTAPAGEPAMPYFATSFLLPPGHKALEIQIIPGEEIILEGKFMIYPMQHSQPLSKGGSGVFIMKDEIYATDASYPREVHGELSTQIMNGYAFSMCTFSPARYNPVSGKLSYFKSIKVKLTTSEDSKSMAALQNLNSSPRVLKQIESISQNNKHLSSYPKTNIRNDDYELLIISPSVFANGFEQMVNFYLPRGIRSRIICTDSIYANSFGQDNPEKIRNFIIQEYQNHNIQHLSLGGDIEHVPYRGLYCSVQSSSVYEDENIPSDLYYAALDGTWNDNGNSRWGEIGEDDLLPEIGVGRFCISSQADFDALMNKTLQYQQNPVLGELDKPFLVGEYLYDNPETWGSDYLELLIGYHDDNGYQTTGIPTDQNIQKLYASETSWDKNTLMSRMNQGTSFIHHVGHANATYTMLLYNSDISNANFLGLDGDTHNYALIYSHGCICGAFDNDDCIAERMINIENLAAAVYMNSRYGWFNEGQTEGPAAHINRELADAFYDKKENHLGMALSLARVATTPWVNAPGQHEEGALRWNFYDCNLLGDAALAMWTDEPMEVSASLPDSIPATTPSISVSITGNRGSEGLCCSFMVDNICYGSANTDISGQAEIIFSQTLPQNGTAQICVSGYNCLMHEFPVVITPSQQYFQKVWNTPFNAMTFFVTEASIDESNMQAGDEIGLFDIDPISGNEICVGTGILSQELVGGAYLEIVASMDDGSNSEQANGFTPGNEIIYKLWNETMGEITDVNPEYPYPGYDENYTALGSAIVKLSGTQTDQHTIALASGWTGISSYLIPSNTNIEELFSEITTQLTILENPDGFYQPEDPTSTLETWDYTSGYIIKVNQNTQLTITGNFPENKSITLNRGWNLIPVLSDQTLSIQDLFASHLNNIIIIKDAVGSNVYWPNENISSLQTLQAGRAYLIKTSTGFSFSF